jgi:hypothetical protein
MIAMNATFYTPQPDWWVQRYGYWPGYTYWLNGYRMYLHESGYFYYVDHPDAAPVRASRHVYRTGGVLGMFAKVFGVISLIAGIGLMFGEGAAFIAPGAILISLGLFGTVLALADSLRNHPTAWRAGATVALVAYGIHSLTDNDD